MRFILSIAVLTITVTSAPAFAQSQDSPVTIVVGADASQGKYGSDRTTTIITAPVSVRYKSGPVEIGVTVPYMRIDTPGVVFSGIDGTPVVMTPDLGGPRRVHQGVGDPTVTASVEQPIASDFFFRATGRVKIPVDGLRSVSTGKVDWSVSGELSKSFGGFTPFASLTYRHFGNPAGWDIRDGLAASVGATVPLAGGTLAASWDWARSTSVFQRDIHEVVAIYSAPIAPHLRLGAFGTLGLSRGAPAYGTGLRLTVTP